MINKIDLKYKRNIIINDINLFFNNEFEVESDKKFVYSTPDKMFCSICNCKQLKSQEDQYPMPVNSKIYVGDNLIFELDAESDDTCTLAKFSVAQLLFGRLRAYITAYRNVNKITFSSYNFTDFIRDAMFFCKYYDFDNNHKLLLTNAQHVKREVHNLYYKLKNIDTNKVQINKDIKDKGEGGGYGGIKKVNNENYKPQTKDEEQYVKFIQYCSNNNDYKKYFNDNKGNDFLDVEMNKFDINNNTNNINTSNDKINNSNIKDNLDNGLHNSYISSKISSNNNNNNNNLGDLYNLTEKEKFDDIKYNFNNDNQSEKSNNNEYKFNDSDDNNNNNKILDNTKTTTQSFKDLITTKESEMNKYRQTLYFSSYINPISQLGKWLLENEASKDDSLKNISKKIHPDIWKAIVEYNDYTNRNPGKNIQNICEINDEDNNPGIQHLLETVIKSYNTSLDDIKKLSSKLDNIMQGIEEKIEENNLKNNLEALVVYANDKIREKKESNGYEDLPNKYQKAEDMIQAEHRLSRVLDLTGISNRYIGNTEDNLTPACYLFGFDKEEVHEKLESINKDHVRVLIEKRKNENENKNNAFTLKSN